MAHYISKTFAQLMEEAPSTIMYYYNRISKSLDEEHGEDWAQQHPEVVASLTLAAVSDFNAAAKNAVTQDLIEAIKALTNRELLTPEMSQK